LFVFRGNIKRQCKQLQRVASADERFRSDQIVDIADQAELDPRDRQVRCDTRKWLMSELAPRRYGDRLLHAGDPDAPIQHVHQDVSALLDQLSPQQLDDLVRFSQSLVDAGQDGDG
jgi:hypothetical protein